MTTTIANQARALNLAAGAGRLPALVLMTDRHRLPNLEAALDRLPIGSAVLFRDYDAADRRARAGWLALQCRSRGLLLIVAGDAGLAIQVGAAGLHLPQHLLRRTGRWRRGRRGWILTAAAHDAAAVTAAARIGADAAILSPVFPTASHPGQPTLGSHRFAALVRHSAIPVYALGGITAMTGRRLKASGAAGLAGISALAVDGRRTETLCDQLRGA